MARLIDFQLLKKFSLCMVMIISASQCSSLLKSSPSNIKKLLSLAQKNIYTAESIEDVSRKNSLLKDAFTKIIAADSFSKTITKENSIHALIAYHYALYNYAMSDFDSASSYAEKARADKSSTAAMDVLLMRINLKLKGKKYVQQTIDNLKAIMAKHPTLEMGHLVLGDFYYYLSDTNNAMQHYQEVLFIGKNHQVLAANRIETLNKINSIRIDMLKYQDLVIAESIKRYEMAHILYDIFQIQVYFQIKKNVEQNFTDLNSLKNPKAIVELYKKGMFSYVKKDQFQPFAIVTRAELAKIIEDFVVLASGSIDYRTMYLKAAKSPIKDVGPDNEFYNAMRIAIKKKIMSVSLSGYMNPRQPVNGLDALSIFKKMVAYGRN